MSRIATIARLSYRATSIQSPTKASPEQRSYVDVLWRRFISAENTTIPGTSTPNQALDQYCGVNNVVKICAASFSSCKLLLVGYIKIHRKASLGFLGVPSLHCMCSSDATTESGWPKNAIDGGNTWIDMSENDRKSTIDASTYAGKNVTQLGDVITLHIQELFGNYQDLEKVIFPLGGTLIGTAMAWFVMPNVLRKLHKYASEAPFITLWGDSTKKDKPYQTSLWGALQDPAKYIITFMAFSQMAAVIAPSISSYLPQAWKGAFIVSFVWFLHRWKSNFIANAMANQAAIGTDRERLSAFDEVSSLGLIALEVIALAEACGISVQSILTVGGVGGIVLTF